jgi:hypothetical protein
MELKCTCSMNTKKQNTACKLVWQQHYAYAAGTHFMSQLNYGYPEYL